MRDNPLLGSFRDIAAPAVGQPGLETALCAAAAAAACHVSPGAIASPRRHAAVSNARHLAIYLQHVAFGVNLSACGRAFARDRASVRHACAKIEDARDEPHFDRAVAHLEQALLTQRRLLRDLSQSFLS